MSTKRPGYNPPAHKAVVPKQYKYEGRWLSQATLHANFDLRKEEILALPSRPRDGNLRLNRATRRKLNIRPENVTPKKETKNE